MVSDSNNKQQSAHKSLLTDNTTSFQRTPQKPELSFTNSWEIPSTATLQEDATEQYNEANSDAARSYIDVTPSKKQAISSNDVNFHSLRSYIDVTPSKKQAISSSEVNFHSSRSYIDVTPSKKQEFSTNNVNFHRSNSYVNLTPCKEQIFAKDTPEKNILATCFTPEKRISGFLFDGSINRTSTAIGVAATPKKRVLSDSLTYRSPQPMKLPINRPRPVLDLLDIAGKATKMSERMQLVSEPFAYSEDSMDWVRMFERDKPNTASVEDQSSFPSSSLPHVAEAESDMNTSPNIFTPIRDGKQPFASPYLSASSLETLENAPILSPRMTKSKRSTSCRKRIDVPAE